MARLGCLLNSQLAKFSTGSISFTSLSSSSLLFFAKGEPIRLPALNSRLGCSRIEMSGAELRSTKSGAGFGRARGPRPLNASSESFSSPKTGSVGTERFKEGAAPGTYWSDSLDLGEDVSVSFKTGSNNVTVNCRGGENLLKVAELGGVMVPTRDFCFEGSCYHCEMEVEGGAIEVGYADPTGSELIRSCICPVPRGRQTVVVNVFNDDDEWGVNIV